MRGKVVHTERERARARMRETKTGRRERTHFSVSSMVCLSVMENIYAYCTTLELDNSKKNILFVYNQILFRQQRRGVTYSGERWIWSQS